MSVCCEWCGAGGGGREGDAEPFFCGFFSAGAVVARDASGRDPFPCVVICIWGVVGGKREAMCRCMCVGACLCAGCEGGEGGGVAKFCVRPKYRACGMCCHSSLLPPPSLVPWHTGIWARWATTQWLRGTPRRRSPQPTRSSLPRTTTPCRCMLGHAHGPRPRLPPRPLTRLHRLCVYAGVRSRRCLGCAVGCVSVTVCLVGFGSLAPQWQDTFAFDASGNLYVTTNRLQVGAGA
jgi:hypothetical protein